MINVVGLGAERGVDKSVNLCLIFICKNISLKNLFYSLVALDFVLFFRDVVVLAAFSPPPAFVCETFGLVPLTKTLTTRCWLLVARPDTLPERRDFSEGAYFANLNSTRAASFRIPDNSKLSRARQSSTSTSGLNVWNRQKPYQVHFFHGTTSSWI